MTSTGEQPGIDAPRQIRRWNFWHFLRLPSLSDFNDLKSELRRHDEQCGEIRSLLLEELSVLQKGIASVKQTCLSSAEKQLQSLTELNNLLQALQKFSYGFRSEVQELARTIDTDHRDAQKAMIASQGKIIDESLTHANMVGDRLQHIHLEETRAQLEKMTSLSTALNERIMNTHREFQNKLDAFSALMNQLHESGTTGLSAKISVSQKELSEQFKSMEYTHSQDIVILRREMIQAAAKGNDMLEKLFDAKMSLIEKMTGDVSRAMEIRTSLNREHVSKDDFFWGRTREGQGRNILGKALMRMRSDGSDGFVEYMMSSAAEGE